MLDGLDLACGGAMVPKHNVGTGSSVHKCGKT